MKRLLLALLVIGLGTAALECLRHAGQSARAVIPGLQSECAEAAKRLATMEIERDAVRSSVEEASARNEALPLKPSLSPALTEWLLSDPSRPLSDAVVLDLKAALGLNWNSAGDFVWVSKTALGRLAVGALTNGGLTEVVCSLLSISPEERTAAETAIGRSAAANGQWFREHLRREEPAGDVVVQYKFPASFNNSTNLTGELAASLAAALGPERGPLLTQYAGGQLPQQIGLMPNLETTLTVRRSTNSPGSGLAYEFRRTVAEDSLPVHGEQEGEVFGLGRDPERERQRLAEIAAYHQILRSQENQRSRRVLPGGRHSRVLSAAIAHCLPRRLGGDRASRRFRPAGRALGGRLPERQTAAVGGDAPALYLTDSP